MALSAIQFTHIIDYIIVMPLGPMAMRELSIGPKRFGLLVAAYGLSACVASIVAAGILDRFDRKRSLLSLYAGFTVSTFLCGVAPGYGWLLAARFLAGAFGGVAAVAVLAIVGDLFADERRGTATGFVMSAFAVATIAGVPAGLYAANSYGLGAPFWMLAIVSVGVFAVAAWSLPSLNGHLASAEAAHPPLLGNIAEIVADANHRRAFAFMVALVMGTFTVVPYLGAYIVGNAGRTEADLPTIYLVAGCCTLVSLNAIGRLADRLGKLPVFRTMALLAAATAVGLTNLPRVSLPIATAVAALFMVTTSGRMVPAQAMMTACAAPGLRGGFLSLNSAVQHFACGVASLLSAMLLGRTPDGRLTGYPVVGCISVLAALVGVYLAGTLRVAESQVADASIGDLADMAMS